MEQNLDIEIKKKVNPEDIPKDYIYTGEGISCAMRIWSNALGTRYDTYHSCTNHCQYCQPAGSLVWMADGNFKKIEDIIVGDNVIGMDYDSKLGFKRKYRISKVINTMKRVSRVIKIEMFNGNVLFCTPDHHWMSVETTRYKYESPRVGMTMLKCVTPLSPIETEDYKLGYVHGVFDGDGCVTDKIYDNRNKKRGRIDKIKNIRLSVKDMPIIDRCLIYLKGYGFSPNVREVEKNFFSFCIYGKKALNFMKIEFKNKSEYFRGYLAGIFDAEGSCGITIMRIGQYELVNKSIVDKIKECLDFFGFDYSFNGKSFTVRKAYLNFWIKFRPALWRKFSKKIIGRTFNNKEKVLVKKIENIGEMNVYSLETSTHTYIGQGYASRNCFAAGMQYAMASLINKKYDPNLIRIADVKSEIINRFDRIFNKNNILPADYVDWAISKRWLMECGTMGEILQPIDKKLGVTKAFLETIKFYKFPVFINTKGNLLFDDEYYKLIVSLPIKVIDLTISTDETTPEFRRWEPFSPSPEKRLDMIRKLSQDGVPVVASLRPILKGVTDKNFEKFIENLCKAGVSTVHLRTLILTGIQLKRPFLKKFAEENMRWKGFQYRYPSDYFLDLCERAKNVCKDYDVVVTASNTHFFRMQGNYNKMDFEKCGISKDNLFPYSQIPILKVIQKNIDKPQRIEWSMFKPPDDEITQKKVLIGGKNTCLVTKWSTSCIMGLRNKFLVKMGDVIHRSIWQGWENKRPSGGLLKVNGIYPIMDGKEYIKDSNGDWVYAYIPLKMEFPFEEERVKSKRFSYVQLKDLEKVL